MSVERKDTINIPYPMLAIVFTLVVQTLGGVWWASAMNAKMEFLQALLNKLEISVNLSTKDRYTSQDAVRDWSANDRRVSSLESLVEVNRRAIVGLQIEGHKISKDDL